MTFPVGGRESPHSANTSPQCLCPATALPARRTSPRPTPRTLRIWCRRSPSSSALVLVHHTPCPHLSRSYDDILESCHFDGVEDLPVQHTMTRPSRSACAATLRTHLPAIPDPRCLCDTSTHSYRRACGSSSTRRKSSCRSAQRLQLA